MPQNPTTNSLLDLALARTGQKLDMDLVQISDQPAFARLTAIMMKQSGAALARARETEDWPNLDIEGYAQDDGTLHAVVVVDDKQVGSVKVPKDGWSLLSPEAREEIDRDIQAKRAANPGELEEIIGEVSHHIESASQQAESFQLAPQKSLEDASGVVLLFDRSERSLSALRAIRAIPGPLADAYADTERWIAGQSPLMAALMQQEGPNRMYIADQIEQAEALLIQAAKDATARDRVSLLVCGEDEALITRAERFWGGIGRVPSATSNGESQSTRTPEPGEKDDAIQPEAFWPDARRALKAHSRSQFYSSSDRARIRGLIDAMTGLDTYHLPYDAAVRMPGIQRTGTIPFDRVQLPSPMLLLQFSQEEARANAPSIGYHRRRLALVADFRSPGVYEKVAPHIADGWLTRGNTGVDPRKGILIFTVDDCSGAKHPLAQGQDWMPAPYYMLIDAADGLLHTSYRDGAAGLGANIGIGPSILGYTTDMARASFEGIMRDHGASVLAEYLINEAVAAMQLGLHPKEQITTINERTQYGPGLYMAHLPQPRTPRH